MRLVELPEVCNCFWEKVLKSGLSKFCGGQSLKNLLSPLLNTLPYFTLEYFAL